MELNALHTIMTAGGMVIGMAAGYYKSRSDLTEKLKKYVTVEDCKQCGVKEDLAEIKKDLRDGNRTFMSLKIDMAVIKAKMGIQDDMEELKKSLAVLESQRS